MTYGRFSHGPRRYGRARRSTCELVQSGLLADYGSAFDTSESTVSFVEAMAHARALDACGSQLRRLRNQFDPQRMTDFLPRWEAIFGISPVPGSSMNARRAEVARRMSFLGRNPNGGELQALLEDILPDLAPVVLHTSSSDAITYASKNAPGGCIVPGGITTPPKPPDVASDWSSTISYIVVLVTRPSWMTIPDFNNAFYSQAGRVHRYLRDFLPAWCTYSVAADLHSFPSGVAGFYLDEPDLDIERLTFYIDGPTRLGGAFTQPIFPYILSLGWPGTTYANYYRLTIAGPVLTTIDITRAVGSGIQAVLYSGSSRTGALVTSSSTGTGHLNFSATLNGTYVLEVNSNNVDAIDGETQPFLATITIT